MELHIILARLRQAHYKFTEAQRLRSEIRQLPEEEQDAIISKIRTQVQHPSNGDIQRPLREVIWRQSDLGLR